MIRGHLMGKVCGIAIEIVVAPIQSFSHIAKPENLVKTQEQQLNKIELISVFLVN